MLAHKLVFTSFISTLTLLVLIGSSSYSDPKSKLSEFFRRAELYGFTGSVLIARGDDVLLEQAYGFADEKRGLRANVETAYSVGSITKQFTAAAILDLESKGKLSTADSIADHLDFVPEEKRGITIHHLLTHTSGFGNYYWDQFPSLSEEEYLRQQMKNVKLGGEPGERHRYTNFGYHLLAAIIERVSGMDYEAYLRQHLLLPAGMQNSGLHLPEWAPGQVAQYQDWTTRAWKVPVQDPLQRPAFLQLEGSGGFFSTPQDLYRWHRALKENAILSPEATSRMFTPYLSDYGYGWHITETSRGTKLIAHGGFDTSLGVVCGFYRFVDEDIVVIFLANSTLNRTLQHPYLVHQIENILFDKAFSMPPKPQSISQDTLASYSGVYAMPSAETIEVLVRNGRLVAVTESPAAVRALMFPNSGEPIAKKEKATELTLFMKALRKGKLGALSDTIDPRINAERFVRRWKSFFERNARDNGKLLRIREIHSHEFFYDGKPETQYYLHVEFAQRDLVLRAIGTESGWLALNVFSLPERLELTLAPGGDDQFHGWDFRLGMGPEITFTLDNGTQSLEMHISGERAKSIAKRNLEAPIPTE